jgi:hypothetical protein
MRNGQENVSGNLDGKDPFARSSYSWESNMKIDLNKKIGCECAYRIQLASVLYWDFCEDRNESSVSALRGSFLDQFKTWYGKMSVINGVQDVTGRQHQHAG